MIQSMADWPETWFMISFNYIQGTLQTQLQFWNHVQTFVESTDSVCQNKERKKDNQQILLKLQMHFHVESGDHMDPIAHT